MTSSVALGVMLQTPCDFGGSDDIRKIGEAAGGLAAATAIGALAVGTAHNLAQDQESYVTPATDVPGSIVLQDPVAYAHQVQVTGTPLDSADVPTIPPPTQPVGITTQQLVTPLPAANPQGHIYLSGQNDHSVYVVRNPATGETTIYVGRTSQGLTSRERQHRDIPGREGWDLDLVRDGLTLEKARELEQELIITYGLSNLVNKRNEIAPTKWSDRLKGLFQKLQGE